MAADQTRAIARLRSQRLILGANVPRAALEDSLALGYCLAPFQGFSLRLHRQTDREIPRMV